MAFRVSDEDAAATLARGHLESNAVGFIGPLMQSVGDIRPTGSIALGLPLVAIIVGGAAWLSWLLCSIAVLCIAYCCAQVAKKYSTTAGLAGLTLGAGAPAIGVATSLCILGFYILITPTNLIGDAYLFEEWFGTIGVGESRGLLFVIGLAILAFSVYLPLRGIRVAATALLIGEGATIILAIMLMIAILAKHSGQIIDSSQLRLHGLSVHEVLFGVAVGIFGFAGFETSATLGKETRDPHKNIPRSLYWSVISCGLLFVVAAYILDLGFHGSNLTLGTSSSPLADVARLNGVGWLASPLTFGVALSILGATMASVNSGARYILTLARDGLLPGPWGVTSPSSATRCTCRAALSGGGAQPTRSSAGSSS
jgi:amino acid transporter